MAGTRSGAAECALEHAEKAILPDRSVDQIVALEADLADVEAAVRPADCRHCNRRRPRSVVDALKSYDLSRRELFGAVRGGEGASSDHRSGGAAEGPGGLHRRLAGLLRANVQQALRRLVKGRLTFTPCGDHYEFSGIGTVKPLLAG